MSAVLFLAKFLAATTLFFVVTSLVLCVISRFEPTPRSLSQSVTRVLGTHTGRLRFLLLAGATALALTLVYPGPPLLVSEGGEKTFHYLWYGNDPAHPYVQSERYRSTWFWGQATLLYFGAFAMYILFVVPDVIAAAMRAARSASQPNSTSG